MSFGLSFAVLVLEREPLTVDDLPVKFQSWLQDVGGFAAIGLGIWLLGTLAQKSAVKPVSQRRPVWFRMLFTLGCIGAGLAYGALGVMLLPGFLAMLAGNSSAALTTLLASPLCQFLLTAGGACAVFAVALPFAVDLVRLRFRRIGALAILSFREAVRRKVYLVFCALLIVFLFLDWFVPHKPENQLRTYVQIIYWAMTPMLLFTAALLAAFSIPTDVRNQTIHTIITKPVERFEIVLGRFLGYAWLLSLTLAVMVVVSLSYVWVVGVHPDAEEVSYRARVPIYGELQLHGAKGRFQGNEGLVGREWEYRRYIAGGANSPQRAVWLFRELPTRLSERKVVPCEFGFDIFRQVKGEGVLCTFAFQTRNWSPDDYREFELAREAARRNPPPGGEEESDNELAKRFGYYQFRSKEITDFHSFRVDVPAGLFENARGPDNAKPSPPVDGKAPILYAVVVKCETPSGFVGMAKRDLYLVDADGYFALNFLKGSAGLWCRLCLVIGIAVACSTYLSGVISLICTLFLSLLGLFLTFAISVAAGTNEGGGPAEAFYRLVNTQNATTPLDQTPVVKIANWSDEGFRWFLRRFLNVVPDMKFYDMSDYVSEGFNITLLDIGLHVLVLFGYLLPWAVLAYYLMKSREIAS